MSIESMFSLKYRQTRTLPEAWCAAFAARQVTALTDGGSVR
jgi:hypothetical protein